MLQSAASTSQTTCKICGQKATCNNFGALSCRACAAFFRRNALNQTVLKCDNSARCRANEKFFCKKCRMDKCREEGMDVKRFQMNRDVLKTASNFKSLKSRYYEISIPSSMSTFLGRPSSILCCEPDKASHVKSIIDVSPMIHKVERILRSSYHDQYSVSSNSLEKLKVQHENMRKGAPNFDMMVVVKIEKSHVLRIWEDAFVETATWISHFDEFKALPEAVQMTIIKSSWGLWSKMDKLAETAAHLKQRMISDNVLIIGNGIGVDRKRLDMDVTWLTNYSKEQAEHFQPMDLNNNFAKIVMELVELDPSKEELAYMLGHLCLFISGKRNSDISSITDRLLEILANNLHHYYQSTQKCTMYSTRIVKMMRINNMLIKDMWEKKERQHLAKVFNIYCFEVSDEFMFEGI